MSGKIHYTQPGHEHTWCGRNVHDVEVTTTLANATCLRCITHQNPSPRFLMDKVR